MLSGVASDEEVQTLAQRFSDGELVRIMNLIHQTAAGFSKSAGRRLDVELLLVNLCRPALCLEPEAINARLTRVEDQLRTGAFTVKVAPAAADEEEQPPMFTDADIPPVPGEEEAPPTPVNEAPEGFWVDLVTQLRRELKPPLSAFFAPTPNAPVKGYLQGNRLVLLCTNQFAMEMVNKPETLQLVSAKASAMLGKKVATVATDQASGVQKNEQMERLLDFGRSHSDIVTIKND